MAGCDGRESGADGLSSLTAPPHRNLQLSTKARLQSVPVQCTGQHVSHSRQFVSRTGAQSDQELIYDSVQLSSAEMQELT